MDDQTSADFLNSASSSWIEEEVGLGNVELKPSPPGGISCDRIDEGLFVLFAKLSEDESPISDNWDWFVSVPCWKESSLF